MAEVDQIYNSISERYIYRKQILQRCNKLVPPSTLSRQLRPETLHTDICQIKLEARNDDLMTLNKYGKSYMIPPPDDKVYLMKGKALESIFGKPSASQKGMMSFRIVKKSDELRTFFMVELRSEKRLENCTAKIIPVTGSQRQDEIIEYETWWKGRQSTPAIDLNPNELAYAHLITIPHGDSRIDHDKLLYEKIKQTSDPAQEASLVEQMNYFAHLPWYMSWPTCHLTKLNNVKSDFSISSSYHLQSFPYILVLMIYWTNGLAYSAFLLDHIREPEELVISGSDNSQKNTADPYYKQYGIVFANILEYQTRKTYWSCDGRPKSRKK